MAAQHHHTLSSYYLKRFKEVHGRTPDLNRYAAQWGWKSMLEDMGLDHCKKVVDFYFTTPADRDHSLDWFFYHYHELSRSMQDAEKDAESVEKIMQASRKRAEEWRASGKRGITSD